MNNKLKKIMGICLSMVLAFSLALPVYAKQPDYEFDGQTGHLIVGKDINNKKITDIVPIPKDEIKSVTIKDGVKKMRYSAFRGCTGLTSITIPDSVKEISEGAFAFCTGLTSVTIPNSVTSIGHSAFSGCTGLTSINVDKGNQHFKSIDGILFSKDEKTLIQYPAGKKATNYIIPDSVTSIDSGAFEGCTGLTSINADEENKNFKSIDGVLFSKDEKTLIQYPAGKKATNYIIPNSVKEIGEWAFKGRTGLTEVTIPNSVTEIGEYAFFDCTGLTSVNIPNSVKSIGESAFHGCTGLKEVTIPKSTKIVKVDFWHQSFYIMFHTSFDLNTKINRK